MSDLFSEIQLWPVANSRKVKANGSVLVANTLTVKFALFEGKNGAWLALPTEKYEKDGQMKYADKVWFPKVEHKDQLTEMVVKAYNEKTGEQLQASQRPQQQTNNNQQGNQDPAPW